MSMTSHEWTNCILDIVKKIADKNYQEKAWFNKSQQISSPEEMICTLFDDYCFEIYLDDPGVALTQNQRKLGFKLKEWMDEYSSKSEDCPDAALTLQDPTWIKVRSAADEFLASLRGPIENDNAP